MDHIKPTLSIVAGPNGSGKTTTTITLLNHKWAEDSLYINPDNIAQDTFGDWNAPNAVLKAAEYATSLRYSCLANRNNFVFETVFSSQEKIDFLKQARDADYFIRIFFICTNNPKINVSRVTDRFLAGGHEVPISKIISRYYKSLENLLLAIPLADRIYLYDNSADGKAPTLVLKISRGSLQKVYQDTLPEWVYPIVRRLQENRQVQPKQTTGRDRHR